jgi:hypothetical protein
MPIPTCCPRCDREWNYPDSQAGLTVECAKCGKEIDLPEAVSKKKRRSSSSGASSSRSKADNESALMTWLLVGGGAGLLLFFVVGCVIAAVVVYGGARARAEIVRQAEADRQARVNADMMVPAPGPNAMPVNPGMGGGPPPGPEVAPGPNPMDGMAPPLPEPGPGPAPGPGFGNNIGGMPPPGPGLGQMIGGPGPGPGPGQMVGGQPKVGPPPGPGPGPGLMMGGMPKVGPPPGPGNGGGGFGQNGGQGGGGVRVTSPGGGPTLTAEAAEAFDKLRLNMSELEVTALMGPATTRMESPARMQGNVRIVAAVGLIYGRSGGQADAAELLFQDGRLSRGSARINGQQRPLAR